MDLTFNRHELHGVVKPCISVDEFSPKSGTASEVIVVGFYVAGLDPAKELNSFIQRSPVDTIDCETSPNPDENGDYVVFVEVKRTPLFPAELNNILRDVDNLVGNVDWMVKVYTYTDDMPFNSPECAAALAHISSPKRPDEMGSDDELVTAVKEAMEVTNLRGDIVDICQASDLDKYNIVETLTLEATAISKNIRFDVASTKAVQTLVFDYCSSKFVVLENLRFAI